MDVERMKTLYKADPFIRVLSVIDALPSGHVPNDQTPLRDVLPGTWPTLGELRELIAAIKEQ